MTMEQMTLTANGVTRTFAEWAKVTGISESTIRERVQELHWSPEDAVTKPVRTPKFGKPLRQIAKEAGIPFGTLAARLSRGWTLKEAIAGEK